MKTWKRNRFNFAEIQCCADDCSLHGADLQDYLRLYTINTLLKILESPEARSLSLDSEADISKLLQLFLSKKDRQKYIIDMDLQDSPTARLLLAKLPGYKL